MGNHLRDLVENIEAGRVCFLPHQNKGWWNQAPEFVLDWHSEAMCFDIGSHQSLNGFKVIPEIARLPFKACWVEFQSDAGNYTCGAMLVDHDGKPGGHVWVKNHHEWCFSFAFLCGENQTKFQAVEPGKEDVADEIVCAFRCFLTALNCTNVRRVECTPDAKLQKARAKRGKKPLFSFWTLELAPSTPEAGAPAGGTHVSPRLHLRRGHARQYAQGKYTWVQPCVVGNKALGIIHKDYRLAP